MKELIFWIKSLFVVSFEGIERMIKSFDYSFNQSNRIVGMFEQKVLKYVNSHQLNIDELLTLLNALPKDNGDQPYSFELKMDLGRLIGDVFIKEMKATTSYDQCNDMITYVMDRTEGYLITQFYFAPALKRLGELSGEAYQQIIDKFESDVFEFINDPEVLKMAVAKPTALN